MVAEAIVYVDVEGAARAWARAAVPSVDGRVFFGATDAAARPQIVVQRIGGDDDAAALQWDVWGTNKANAAEVAAELASACSALAGFVHGGAILKAAAVEFVRWLPDPDGDQPRYIVETTFTASAA